jgi:hypothetical protein
MDKQPTPEELQAWWDGLGEGSRAALAEDPDRAVPEEYVDEVISYQNGITTFARWDRGLREVHLQPATQDFVRSLG